MIVRGTTPYHTFSIPAAAEDVTTAYVTYLQNDEVILDKSLNDIEIETDEIESEETEEIEIQSTSTITVHLTQEDTLKFHFYPAAEKNIAVVQVRYLDSNNEAYALPPHRERIFGVLKDGVISNNN